MARTLCGSARFALINEIKVHYQGKKMIEWADIDEDGELIIDWNEVFQNSLEFDSGDRTFDSCLGKLISSIQRESFERGFAAGVEAKHPQAKILAYTGGNA